MKHRFIAITLCVLAFFSFYPSAFADENMTNIETILFQDFNDPTNQAWFSAASQTTADQFPKLGFVDGFPAAITQAGAKKGQNGKSLAVAVLFNDKGYNWVDIMPGTPGKPVELPLTGIIKSLSTWVWSGNYQYYMEVYLRDINGIVHGLPMGSLAFSGWKNMKTDIPTNIRQETKYLPRVKSLSLVKFRIWATPFEVAANPSYPLGTPLEKSIRFFFNSIKITTDTYSSYIDGQELNEPESLNRAFGASR